MFTAFQMQKLSDVGRPTRSSCLYTKYLKWKYESLTFFILHSFQSICAMAIGLHVYSRSSPPFERFRDPVASFSRPSGWEPIY